MAVKDDHDEFMKDVAEHFRRGPGVDVMLGAREQLEKRALDKEADMVLAEVGLRVPGGYKTFETNSFVRIGEIGPVLSVDECSKVIEEHLSVMSEETMLSLKERIKKEHIEKKDRLAPSFID